MGLGLRDLSLGFRVYGPPRVTMNTARPPRVTESTSNRQQTHSFAAGLQRPAQLSPSV